MRQRGNPPVLVQHPWRWNCTAEAPSDQGEFNLALERLDCFEQIAQTFRLAQRAHEKDPQLAGYVLRPRRRVLRRSAVRDDVYRRSQAGNIRVTLLRKSARG